HAGGGAPGLARGGGTRYRADPAARDGAPAAGDQAMRDRGALCAALFVAVCALPARADAQRVNPVLRSPAAPIATRLGVLLGSVADPASGPIAGAEVSVVSADVRVRSNAEGRFRFIDVPLGQHLLVVRRSGFRPLAAVVELGR